MTRIWQVTFKSVRISASVGGGALFGGTDHYGQCLTPLSAVFGPLSSTDCRPTGLFSPWARDHSLLLQSVASNHEIVELQRTSERHDKLLEDMRSKLDLLVEKLTRPPPPVEMSLIPTSQTPHPSREGSPGRGRVVPGEEPMPGGDEPYFTNSSLHRF